MTRRDFAQTRYSIKIAEITRRLDEMTRRGFAETRYSVKIAEITRRIFLAIESLRQGVSNTCVGKFCLLLSRRSCNYHSATARFV